MFDDTSDQDISMERHFTQGTPVYDVNGNKVGTISENGAQGDNLVLQKGLIFPHDYYVPLRAVSGADVDGIYLNVTKDDVTDQTFDDVPPASTAGAASGDSDTTMPYPAVDRDVRGNPIPEMEHMLVQRDIDLGPDAFVERDFDVPLRGEQVVANKEARVAEEVHLHKQQVTENQRVDDMVRKERVRVEGDGIDQGQGEAPLERDTLAYDQDVDETQQPRRGI